MQHCWKSLGLRRKAARRRARGQYDATTRRLLAQALKLCPGPAALLDYAKFLRDLGHRLPTALHAPLEEALPRLLPARRRIALALLTEAAPARAARLPARWLRDAARRPVVAALLGESDRLATLVTRASLWQVEFLVALRDACTEDHGGVCVVGNSAAMMGGARGAAIDKHDLVIRFNNCFAGAAAEVDLGLRTDIWVVAPGFDGPAVNSRWAVVTGPDARTHLQAWQAVESHVQRGLPVLTVSLAVWRDLVRELCAPPSAGILILAMLHALLGSWRGVRVWGIGDGGLLGRYHHGLPLHAASTRHDWAAEAKLIRRWQGEGLERL